jgi:hypothetical protein
MAAGTGRSLVFAETLNVPEDHSTIQAAALAAKPGDLVLVAPGLYAERVTFTRGTGGTKSKPLTFRSAKPLGAEMQGFDTKNASHLVIEGFTIKTQKGDGVFVGSEGVHVLNNRFEEIPGSAVRATAPQSNIVVRGNSVFRCQRGFMVKGNDWLVEGNTVERLVHTNGETDYVDFFGKGHVFRRNKFFGTIPSEIGKMHSDGFQTHGEGAQNCTIEENYISDCHQGILLEATKPGGTYGVEIRHNIIANTWAWGILLKKNSEATIEHNLIYNGRIHGIGVRRDTRKPEDLGSKAVVRHNIIVGTRTFVWRDAVSQLESDYNLGFSVRDLKGRRDHDRIGDPLFTDAPNDFTLRAGSPALGAGKSGENLGPRMIWPKSAREGTNRDLE